MKVLAFVDLHGNKKDLKELIENCNKYKPSLLLCAGDISNFGKDLDLLAKEIDELGIKTLIIPGNHETKEQIIAVSKKYKNIINIHLGIYEQENYSFFGYGGGGFSKIDLTFEKISKEVAKEIDKNKKFVFVTHAPVYETKTDLLYGEHKGNKSFLEFIKKTKPILVVCGHFHENTKKHDVVEKALIINPGPRGIILEI